MWSRNFLCTISLECVLQIAMFRSLRDADGNKLTHNFRPIQPLNERIVLANSPHSEDPEYQPKFFDPLSPPPIVLPKINRTDELDFNVSWVPSTVSESKESTLSTTPQTESVTLISAITYSYPTVEPLLSKIPTSHTKEPFPAPITEISSNSEELIAAASPSPHKEERRHRGRENEGARLTISPNLLLVLFTTVLITNLAL